MVRLEPNPVILARLEALRDYGVEAAILSSDECFELDEEIRRLFIERSLAAIQVHDACDDAREDVLAWLRRLPVDPGQQVVVLWPHARTAARLRFEHFTSHYDDLWYPAADDVWITDNQRSWLLQIDHEEQLSFWSRPVVSD